MQERAVPSRSLKLDADQLDRTFPFHLQLDRGLQVQAMGPSLRKLVPDLGAGDPFTRHFLVNQPAGIGTFEDWTAGAGDLVILRSRSNPAVVLRGTVEPVGDNGLIFLVTVAAASFDKMRQLGLGLKDYALYDSVAEVLRSGGGQHLDTMELRLQIEQLRAIVELGDSGVLHAGPGGGVAHVNRTLCEMFGIDESRVAGLTLDAFEKHLGELLAPEESQRQPISALLDAVLESQGQAAAVKHTRTIRLISPRRVTLLMSLTLTSRRDIVLYFRDITSEAEVDRMKSEFLSTAAHELRTPLASIFGFAELMMTRKMPPEQQQELLGTIHRQSQLLINLINELLDLSRIESRQGKDFHRQYCRIGTIIDQTIKGLLIKHDKRQVKLHMPHGAEAIMVDPEKTQQALLNVLSNAFKYSPNGGDIALETVLKEEGADRFVGIRVTDQGMGMTTEQLGRVFERFWRSDPSGAIPGTGLGMSLVKEITELQEGHVQIESMPQQGTVVTLWFPLTADFVLSRPSDLRDPGMAA
jgi:signal transduction histidine kinase